MNDSAKIKLLRSAIDASGLTAKAFARDVLIREPRTLHRWLAGDSPIPQTVISWLRENSPKEAA